LTITDNLYLSDGHAATLARELLIINQNKKRRKKGQGGTMKKVMVVITLMTVALMMAWGTPSFADEMAKVNINTANQEQLMSLKGIGESYAQRIIEYREKNGPFQTPEDLLKVKGIGDKTLEAIKDNIVVKDIKQ
jgi:competence protein ComEA